MLGGIRSGYCIVGLCRVLWHGTFGWNEPRRIGVIIYSAVLVSEDRINSKTGNFMDGSCKIVSLLILRTSG
jgi:hypothetical protein